MYLRSYYYGDFNHAFAAFALAFLVRGQLARGAAFVAIIVLINPTYGVNVVDIFGVFALIRRGPKLTRENFVAASIIATSLVGAYIQIKLSTPISNPVPVAERRFAIESYGHIDGHIYDLSRFLIAQSVLVLILIFAVLRESRARSFTINHNLFVALAVLISYLGFGLFLYFLLYAAYPELFIALASSKMSMIVSLWAVCYVGFGLFEILRRHSVSRLVAAIIISYIFYHFEKIDQYFGYWFASVASAVCAFFFIDERETDDFNTSHREILLGAVLVGLLVSLAGSTAWISNRNYFAASEALLDIEKRSVSVLPANAMVLPFRAAKSSANPYGMFTNFPFRTYSRHGAVTWVVGRNAYFNSMRRHELEEKIYQAATGEPLWAPMLKRAAEMMAADPAHYYFGLNFAESRVTLGTAGAWQIYMDQVGKMITAVNSMNLSEFTAFARRAGANHILICKDPREGEISPAVLQNRYFALVKIAS